MYTVNSGTITKNTQKIVKNVTNEMKMLRQKIFNQCKKKVKWEYRNKKDMRHMKTTE